MSVYIQDETAERQAQIVSACSQTLVRCASKPEKLSDVLVRVMARIEARERGQ